MSKRRKAKQQVRHVRGRGVERTLTVQGDGTQHRWTRPVPEERLWRCSVCKWVIDTSPTMADGQRECRPPDMATVAWA